MTIFLADDQPGVLSALRLLLEQQERVQIGGEASTAGDLMRRVAASGCDVLLVDWDLPDLPRSELLAQAAAANPPLRVIALTTGEIVDASVPMVSKCQGPGPLLQALGLANAGAPCPAGN